MTEFTDLLNHRFINTPVKSNIATTQKSTVKITVPLPELFILSETYIKWAVLNIRCLILLLLFPNYYTNVKTNSWDRVNHLPLLPSTSGSSLLAINCFETLENQNMSWIPRVHCRKFIYGSIPPLTLTSSSPWMFITTEHVTGGALTVTVEQALADIPI